MDGLGIHVVLDSGRPDDAQPIVRVDIDDRHLRSHNIAHGGIVCTVLDTAMGAVAYTAHSARLRETSANAEEVELVTSQLTIHFLRPAWNGETLIGRGHIIHHGSKTIVVRGEVETAAGKPIAAGSGTFMPVTIAPEPGPT